MPTKFRESINLHMAQLSRIESLLYAVMILLCLLLPLSKTPVPLIMVVLFVLSIVRTVQQKGNNILKPGLTTVCLMVLYIIYVAGLIYTSDLSRGFFDLEVKLSFLVVPLIFILSGKNIFNEQRVQTLKLVFVAGALISTFVNLLHATYISLNEYFTFDNYMYNRLSWGFHPSYAALYLNVSILILFLFLIRNWEKLKIRIKILLSVIILYFFVHIIFLNSKMGIIMSGLTLLVLLIYLVISKRKYLLGLLSLAVFLLVSVLILKFTPYISSRLASAWEAFISYSETGTHQNDGTTNRLQVWHYASQVAIKNLPEGVGTGDVRSALNTAYIENGFVNGAAMNLNAHNQFLQTFVAIGLPGLCILVLIIMSLFYSGIKKKNIYILIFSLVLLGNFLVESMLETQAGVIFTIFFICLYDMGERKNSTEIKGNLSHTPTELYK